MRSEVPKHAFSGVRARRREAGNVIIELAMVLPFLLLIVAGIVDLGVLYWEKHILTNASREGARAAARAVATGGAEQTQSQVMAIVQSYLSNFNLKNPDGSALTMAQNSTFYYTWNTGVTPTQLTVDLRNIPVQMMLLPNIQSLYGGASGSSPVMLSGKTTMAAEWTTPPGP